MVFLMSIQLSNTGKKLFSKMRVRLGASHFFSFAGFHGLLQKILWRARSGAVHGLAGRAGHGLPEKLFWRARVGAVRCFAVRAGRGFKISDRPDPYF